MRRRVTAFTAGMLATAVAAVWASVVACTADADANLANGSDFSRIIGGSPIPHRSAHLDARTLQPATCTAPQPLPVPARAAAPSSVIFV